MTLTTGGALMIEDLRIANDEQYPVFCFSVFTW